MTSTAQSNPSSKPMGEVMLLRMGVHKRWHPKFLLRELEKRVIYPPDRPDVKEFDNGCVEGLVQYVDKVDTRPPFGDLNLVGVRLLREGTYGSLGAGHPLQSLCGRGVQYRARSLQLLRARDREWLAQGRDLIRTLGFEDTSLSIGGLVAVGWLNQALALLLATLEMLPLGVFSDANPNERSREPYRRCFAWFTVKLLADWAGQPLPAKLPEHPYPAPAYEALLACWRHPDPVALVDVLLAVCDRHTHECMYSASHKASKDVDFGLDPYMGWPLEVHMVYRLREDLGLTNPSSLDHPLMETGLAPYLPPWPVPEDALLAQVTAKALREFPALGGLL